MYDFRKTQQDPTHGEFYHPFFKYGRQDLLVNIKRKANSKDGGGQSKAAKTRFKKEVYDDEDSDLAAPLLNRSSRMSIPTIHSRSVISGEDSDYLGFNDDVTGSLLNLDNSQDMHKVLVNEADNALLEISKHENLRSRIEQRLNTLELTTRKLEGDNLTLKIMLEESKAKQETLQSRVEAVLRTLFNLVSNKMKLKGSSLKKLLEDVDASGSSSPIDSEQKKGMSEILKFLGIHSPAGRRQIEDVSALEYTVSASTNNAQDIMKLPSFDSGAAKISAPEQPLVRGADTPSLERQSSLDWFRVKEGDDSIGNPLTRQSSIGGFHTVGMKRRSSSVTSPSAASSSAPHPTSDASGSDSQFIASKKQKPDGSFVQGFDEHAAQLSLLGRNQNLTLSRIDSIQQAVQELLSGGDTPNAATADAVSSTENSK